MWWRLWPRFHRSRLESTRFAIDQQALMIDVLETKYAALDKRITLQTKGRDRVATKIRTGLIKIDAKFGSLQDSLKQNGRFPQFDKLRKEVMASQKHVEGRLTAIEHLFSDMMSRLESTERVLRDLIPRPDKT